MTKITLEIPNELFEYLEKNYLKMGFQNVEDFIADWHFVGYSNSQIKYSVPLLLNTINNLESGCLFNVAQIVKLNGLDLPLNVLIELEDMFEKYIYNSNRIKEFELLYTNDHNFLKTYLKKSS